MKGKWAAIAVISIALVFVFLVGISLAGRFFAHGPYRGWGMMGPRMMGGWGFAPFGGIAMLGMMLFPLGLLVLLVLGTTWLVRATSRSGTPTSRLNRPEPAPSAFGLCMPIGAIARIVARPWDRTASCG